MAALHGYTGHVMEATRDRHAGGCLRNRNCPITISTTPKSDRLCHALPAIYLMSQNLPTTAPEEFFIAFLKAVVSFVILAGINPLLTVIIFVLIPVMAVSCSYFNLQVRKSLQTPEKPHRRTECQNRRQPSGQQSSQSLRQRRRGTRKIQ